MAYVLSHRQNKAFTDLVDLYAPLDSPTLDANKRPVDGILYPMSPTYTNVPCRIQPEMEESHPNTMGRSNRDIRISTDILRIHRDQELEDTWYVQNKNPDHPDYLKWYIVQGDDKGMIWRADSKLAYVRRAVEPPRVAP